MTTDVLLVAATALHAGFQLVVTLVVYPALASTPAERWPAAHAAHGRRIVPVVGVVYGSVAVAVVLAVADGVRVAEGVAVAASMSAFAVTAFVAAPAHGRLGRGWGERVLRRLGVADRLRLVAAVTAAVAALAGALG
jgi:hypothetical protein